ncbi:hypothetical protein ACM76A_14125 [Pseudomonas aeruginosa]
MTDPDPVPALAVRGAETIGRAGSGEYERHRSAIVIERTGWSLSLPFGGHFCIAATPALSWRSNPFREQSDDPWTT